MVTLDISIHTLPRCVRTVALNIDLDGVRSLRLWREATIIESTEAEMWSRSDQSNTTEGKNKREIHKDRFFNK